MTKHLSLSGDLKPRALGSLWIGAELGPVEQLCLLSFLEHGHDITLYAYEPVAGVPPGVQVADAREVFDSQKIVRHKKSQSAALHSDFFRYALLAKTSRMWVDLDLFCLRPFIFPSAYVYGHENEATVNGAALSAGDAVMIENESRVTITDGDAAEVLLFDLGQLQ